MSSSPLSPEAEQLLAAIPETIGDAEPGAAAAEVSAEGEALLDLVGEELVDDEDVAELLKMVGETLAKWRRRESYHKAGVRASSIAAKPWAQVINHLWIAYAPSLLISMTANVPGLAKALLMTSIAFGPAVIADVRETKAERATRNRPADTSPIPPAPGPTPINDGGRLRPGRSGPGVMETQ